MGEGAGELVWVDLRCTEEGELAAALKVAREAPAGSVLCAMLPDTGERYLSTWLFDEDNGA